MVSSFYHGDHKLIFHMRRGMGICQLISYDLGIFQFPLDVQSLEKLENSLIFYLCLSLCLTLID